MNHLIYNLKYTAYAAASMLATRFSAFVPTAYASSDYPDGGLSSVQYIVLLLNALLRVFQGAGVILLAYSIIALVLAVKDENAEGKANAITQIGVAVFLVTFATFLSGIASTFGINGIS